MRSDTIKVSSRGDGLEAALNEAEKTAVYNGLDPKSTLHLRLLAEEAMGLMRSITRDAEGLFWIETEGGEFKIHLKTETIMDIEQREKLIAASASGKNEAARGIMGKIREFFEPAEGMPLFFDPSMSFIPMGAYTNLTWSLDDYREQVRKAMGEDGEGAAEAWDELEKSVISHVADDIKVSIAGRDAEMVIFKRFGHSGDC